jgi:FMN reductase
VYADPLMAGDNDRIPSVAVVVGNPKPRSRTLSVAEAVADAAASAAGMAAPERLTVDLADLGGALFDWKSPEVKRAVEAVSRSTLAVVASPTYKASYTGLLKAFLDWYDQKGLDGVTVIPVMVGGLPHHALAVEVHLRPVLIEIGATLPTRGLYVTEDQLSELPAVITSWLATAGPHLRHLRSPA